MIFVDHVMNYVDQSPSIYVDANNVDVYQAVTLWTVITELHIVTPSYVDTYVYDITQNLRKNPSTRRW